MRRCNRQSASAKRSTTSQDRRFEVTGRRQTRRGKYDSGDFEKKDGKVFCPEGKPMELKTVTSLGEGNTVSIYEGQECQSCPRREKCTKGSKRTSRC